MIPQSSSQSYTTHPFRLSYPFRPFSTLFFEDAFAIPASTPSPSPPLRPYTVKVNYTLSQWIRTPETLQHYFPKPYNVVSCFLRFTSLFILSSFPLFLHFRRTLIRALHSLSPPSGVYSPITLFHAHKLSNRSPSETCFLSFGFGVPVCNHLRYPVLQTHSPRNVELDLSRVLTIHQLCEGENRTPQRAKNRFSR